MQAQIVADYVTVGGRAQDEHGDTSEEATKTESCLEVGRGAELRAEA